MQEMTMEEKVAREREVRAVLALPPRQLRLLTAVHEAGHAVAAHTMGMVVMEAHVDTYDRIGLGYDHVAYKWENGHRGPMLLASHMAGLAASYVFMQGRGWDPRDQDLADALSSLASGDIHQAREHVAEVTGRPYGDTLDTVQRVMEPLTSLIRARWLDVVRLGYALARHGHLDQDALRVYLGRNMTGAVDAMDAYQGWTTANSHLFRPTD